MAFYFVSGSNLILIENGTYNLNNFGDVAMLQVCVARLKRFFPEARLVVLTNQPEKLSELCPGVEGFSSNVFRDWYQQQRIPGSRRFRFSSETDHWWRRQFPGVAERMCRVRQGGDSRMSQFFELLDGASMLVLSGGGYLNDHFPTHAHPSFTLIEAFQRRKKPVLLFGQGIGPLEEPGLARRAASVLPGCDRIVIREAAASGKLLDSFGVPADRVTSVCDDAVELVCAHRTKAERSCLGVNVRVSPYSSIGDDFVVRLGRMLEDFGDRVSARLLGVPISRSSFNDDCEAIRRFSPKVASDDGSDVRTPVELIHRVAQCRVMVTGSYHAAVFALAQGVPVLALAASSYYKEKFGGLVDAFGEGIEVLVADQPDFEAEIQERLHALWRDAGKHEAELVEKADALCAESRAAYEQDVLPLLTIR